MVDVINKTCIAPGCLTRPSYGLAGNPPTYCASHRLTGLIKNSLIRCIGDEKDGECKEFSTHGPNRTTPLHCEKHAVDGESCLVERVCIKCERIDVLNKQGLCVNYCSLEEYDRVFKKRIKQKEEAIGRLLQKEIPHELYSADKVIDLSCSKRRPDFVYHTGKHVVIVEVDENQHNGYLCMAYGDDKDGKMKGEMIRMYEIGQCFDGLPVLFIRYNPDSYRAKLKESAEERHRTLVKWVRYCLEKQDWQNGFMVKYLFYDGYDSTCLTWEDVIPML